MNHASVEQLVGAVRAGHSAAYDELVRRFQDMAVGYASALLGDRGLAEDAAQEAFVAGFHAIGQLREPRAFPGWLRRIIARQCDRLVRRPRPMGSADPARLASDAPAAQHTLERGQRDGAIRDAVARLPEGERIATTLFYMGDHSHAEIAEFLGISLSAVKSRLHSARSRLRDQLLARLGDVLHDKRPSRNTNFALEVKRMIRSIKFLLDAQDMERAVGFYRDALGLAVKVQSDGWSELAHGDAIVALHGGGSGAYHETGLSFTVDDIEAACREVTRHGGRMRSGPSDRPGEPIRLAEVTDPEGNGFMLSQDIA